MRKTWRFFGTCASAPSGVRIRSMAAVSSTTVPRTPTLEGCEGERATASVAPCRSQPLSAVCAALAETWASRSPRSPRARRAAVGCIRPTRRAGRPSLVQAVTRRRVARAARRAAAARACSACARRGASGRAAAAPSPPDRLLPAGRLLAAASGVLPLDISRPARRGVPSAAAASGQRERLVDRARRSASSAALMRLSAVMAAHSGAVTRGGSGDAVVQAAEDVVELAQPSLSRLRGGEH